MADNNYHKGSEKMSDINQKANSDVGSVFDLPRKSFELVKNNWEMFAFVNIVALLSAFVSIFNKDIPSYGNFSTNTLTDNDILTGTDLWVITIVGLLVALVSIFFYSMTVGLNVDTVRGKKPNIDRLLEIGKKFWLRQLALVIVLSIIIAIGLILLIIPGIIAILRLSFAPYLMYERNLGVMDSLKASAEVTKGKMGAVAAAILVTMGIGIVLGIFQGLPVLGPIIVVVGTIAFSLIIALRYAEINKSGAPKAEIKA